MMTIREFAGAFVVVKGIAIGIVTTAVVQTGGLSDFVRALIIAIVSSTIGGLGMITSALIARQHQDELRERYEKNHAMLLDIQRAGGISRRETDDPNREEC